MTAALRPTPTALDQQVLAQLPEDGTPVRQGAILEGVIKRQRAWLVGSDAVRQEKHHVLRLEVRAILRGLAHLDLAEDRGGGWWRRT